MVSPVGTTYAVAKAALIDRIDTAFAAVDVAVSYQAPLQSSDIIGPNGTGEAVYFEDLPSNGGQDNEVICALPLVIDESYEIPLRVVVIRDIDGDDGTQRAADLRMDELLYTIVKVIGGDPSLGLMSGGSRAEIQHFMATRCKFERTLGNLGTGMGHGAGCLLRVQVEARVAFYQ